MRAENHPIARNRTNFTLKSNILRPKFLLRYSETALFGSALFEDFLYRYVNHSKYRICMKELGAIADDKSKQGRHKSYMIELFCYIYYSE